MVSPNNSSKKPARKPTIKQQKAVANLVGNGGNVTKAMIDAGYSVATANTPQKLTESEYVQQLMREVGLTDVDGFKVLKEGLQATKAVVMGQESQDSFVDVQPDFAVRHKYLETFMKVRGLGKQVEVGGGIHFHNHSEQKKDGYSFGS